MPPTISVIIPVYNAMAFLPEALNSVLTQTFTDFEAIIVNDGSQDNIVEWAKTLSDARVKLISQENQGVSQARNAGILSSRGDYIAFLDADDIWEPEKLASQIVAFKESPELGLVDTWIAFVDEQNNVLFSAGQSYQAGNVLRKILEGNLVMCGSSPVIRRQCFETAGLFDGELQIGEDWHMWVRIAAHYPFQVLKKPLVRYRRHSSNATDKHEQMLVGLSAAIEKIYRLFPSDLTPIKKKAYGRLFLYYAIKMYETKNYSQAKHFFKKALLNYPMLFLSRTNISLFIKSIFFLSIQLKQVS